MRIEEASEQVALAHQKNDPIFVAAERHHLNSLDAKGHPQDVVGEPVLRSPIPHSDDGPKDVAHQVVPSHLDLCLLCTRHV